MIVVVGFRSAMGFRRAPLSRLFLASHVRPIFNSCEKRPAQLKVFLSTDWLFFRSGLKSKAEAAHPEEYRRASKKYTYDDEYWACGRNRGFRHLTFSDIYSLFNDCDELASSAQNWVMGIGIGWYFALVCFCVGCDFWWELFSWSRYIHISFSMFASLYALVVSFIYYWINVSSLSATWTVLCSCLRWLWLWEWGEVKLKPIFPIVWFDPRKEPNTA